jgi:hypothetical protein
MFKIALCVALPLLGVGAYMVGTNRSVTQQAETKPQSPTVSVPTLTQENFARWRDFIRPKKEERLWQQIPWRSSLWEAAQEAGQQDKPVLLWAMNGHPLACT